MISNQKQNLEMFVRVGVFMEQHPVPGPLTYTGPRETLADVVRRLREYSGAQVAGRALGQAETRLQHQLIEGIVERHMRPLVAIARTQIEPDSEVRLPVAIRMPAPRARATRILTASDGMIEAARPYEAQFIANGLPADFLARFTAARDELERALAGRAAQLGTQVGATRGIAVQLRRGRRAIERLDSIVRASFYRDEVTMARWRTAKRVQLLPGGVGSRDEDESPAEPVERAA
jgi:hypothetical protein